MPFIQPRPYSAQINPMMLMMLQQQMGNAAAQGQGGAPAGGGGGGGLGKILFGGGAGAGAYYGLGGGGAGAGVFPAATAGLPSFSFASPSLMAPSFAPALPGAAGAAGASGGAAAGGSAAGTAGSMSLLGPAAFLASAPLWAPIVGKAGDKFAKFAGITDSHPKRRFNAAELYDQKPWLNNPRAKSNFELQVPGYSQMSKEQKDKLFEIADRTKGAGVALPGYADKEGNTQKGLGQEFFTSPIKFSDYGDGSAGRSFEQKYGKFWRTNMPLEKQWELYKGGVGNRLKDEAAQGWQELIDATHAKPPVEMSKSPSGAWSAQPMPMPRPGPGTIGGQMGGMMGMGEAPKMNDLVYRFPPGKQPSIDPGFNPQNWSNVLPNFSGPLFQPQPAGPQRSQTSSPGIGKDGKRINYGARR